jgi:hypothetical protein
MLLFQELCKVMDAFGVGDVQLVEFHVRQAAVRRKGFRLFEKRVVLNLPHSLVSLALVSRHEIYQQRPGIERRFWILQRKLAHNGYGMSVVLQISRKKKPTKAYAFIGACYGGNSRVRHDYGYILDNTERTVCLKPWEG